MITIMTTMAPVKKSPKKIHIVLLFLLLQKLSLILYYNDKIHVFYQEEL